MPIQIGQGRDHGFDEPLGLLSDCHRRIEHFLGVLAALAVRVDGGPLTPPDRAALEGAVRYFAVAAPKHTADEEVSLFPRLRAAGASAASAALAVLDKLEHDHDDADRRHAAVEALVQEWLANNRLSPSATGQLREHLICLQALYEQHIALEDREIFPAAAQVLDPAQIAAIGDEMAARRQVRPLSLITERRDGGDDQ